MVSKPQRTDICAKCGELRPIHAKGRCKNCYMQDFPSKRKVGYCNDPYCPHIGQQVTLVAKGKCKACYERNKRAQKREGAEAPAL
jgi:hypothetical protein